MPLSLSSLVHKVVKAMKFHVSVLCSNKDHRLKCSFFSDTKQQRATQRHNRTQITIHTVSVTVLAIAFIWSSGNWQVRQRQRTFNCSYHNHLLIVLIIIIYYYLFRLDVCKEFKRCYLFYIFNVWPERESNIIWRTKVKTKQFQFSISPFP